MAFKLAQSFQNRTLGLFRGRLDQQLSLRKRIRDSLPQPLADHVLHCVETGRKLTIYTDSAAWASQLRFLNEQIFQAACNSDPDRFEKMQIRIFAEPVRENKKKSGKANLPSPQKIKLIKDEGDNFEESPLGQSLLRLSATMARLSNQKCRPGD